MIRLLELEIKDFRGIKSLKLSPDGESVAILGPNGSGKSSIADAIDFLLTGKIRRLSGEGAGSLKLSEHGRHIDADPSDASVRAIFQELGKKPVALLRSLADPSHLNGHVGASPELAKLITLGASSGAHVLTRRDILQFILVEPSKRAEQVASLLQIINVESHRKEIQGAAKIAKQYHERQRSVKHNCETGLLNSFSPAANDLTEVLDRVNAHRVGAACKPIEELTEGVDFREGVYPPSELTVHPLQQKSIRNLVQQLAEWFAEGSARFLTDAADYRKRAALLREHPDELKAALTSDLVSRGLSLVDGDVCPLCLTAWKEHELRAVLEERSLIAEDAKCHLEELTTECEKLRDAPVVVAVAARLLGSALVDDEYLPSAMLESYANELETIANTLTPDAVDGTIPSVGEADGLGSSMDSTAVRDQIRRLSEAAASMADLEGSQLAWDELTAGGRAYSDLMKALCEEGALGTKAKELGIASRLFVQARDEILANTYQQIAERFAALYCRVHCDDESAFEARLDPTKAGLKLEVAFHGRGEFPPGALHSEGHQDSMGVLLFLALVEFLSGGKVPFVILDDVLMSVDKGHRRALAEMLKEDYQDTQFIITTHDRVWWHQLLALGVARRNKAIEFKDWSIDDGPVIVLEAGDLLKEATEALEQGNIPQAAHALRRATETFLPELCHGLGAQVRYRADQSWQAGDFLDALKARYSRLLKKAKKSAVGWGKDDGNWTEMEERKTAVFSAFSQESWAVNPMIHWNEWADMGSKDFQPVLEAYKGLFGLATCSTCGTFLYVVEEGAAATGVRCNCGQVNWNLKPKEG